MYTSVELRDVIPQLVPKNMSGTKIITGIRIKKDYVRSDGTSALYLRIYESGKPAKKIALDIYVPISKFDEKRQRVKKTHPLSGDYNLIIEQKLAAVNEIMIEYRLQNVTITLERLIEELNNPTSRLDFIVFYEQALKIEENNLAKSTFKQQGSSLKKLKKFSPKLSFTDIDEKWLKEFTGHLRTKEKNQRVTIDTCLKNIKKYLNIARKNGVRFPLDPDTIKIKQPRSNRTYLSLKELDKMMEYMNASFTNEVHQIICAKFLFCCFTGLRLGDFMRLTKDDIIGEYILNYNHKSDFKQKIEITPVVKELLELPFLLENIYTEKHLNEEIKAIAKVLGIKKRISWHVSRHTFAMSYLATGGNITRLQQLMGHSDIKTTMVYLHEDREGTKEDLERFHARFKSL